MLRTRLNGLYCTIKSCSPKYKWESSRESVCLYGLKKKDSYNWHHSVIYLLFDLKIPVMPSSGASTLPSRSTKHERNEKSIMIWTLTLLNSQNRAGSCPPPDILSQKNESILTHNLNLSFMLFEGKCFRSLKWFDLLMIKNL